MDYHRAKEILESPREHDVYFQGKRIWIQNVDNENKTAQIFPATDPNEEMTVPVTDLMEDHA
ncbi:H-type small acid-soluble spore protein [Alteribacter natronophilus]|uniref:H-type small acid-soluble spore protein n=1 Tax=Alteribacter natronophilus TaxID=2583810 RepID=UPI00110E364E|nr:H-type small acid-soluble spore protein [Alteribacter natronophilus]TMW73478.1 H-type small acid-soluble spore protein [Alteribacter natronophilus]